jgi:Ser/Thr protein kinase RdoA (MazF antagonist)
LAATGINEIKWAKAYAKPRINPYRSFEAPETPEEYISLLERYLQLVPYLSPGPSSTSLSHPDLHLDNIFVDPDTKQITCIIDWQSASVSEPFFQHSIPRFLLPVGSSTTSNQLEAATEGYNATDYAARTAKLLSHYQNLTRLKNEQRWAAIAWQSRFLLNKPVSLLCGAWSRNDVFSFRHALIHVAAQWKESALGTVSCPIQFTEEELELHNDEMELLEGLGEVLHQLQNSNLIPLGGMVHRENYEQALYSNHAVKEKFVNMAESESQRVLFSRIWPYQDQDL